MARKFFEVKNYAKRSEANSFWEFKEKQFFFYINNYNQNIFPDSKTFPCVKA